jgi:hypothetical protein
MPHERQPAHIVKQARDAKKATKLAKRMARGVEKRHLKRRGVR